MKIYVLKETKTIYFFFINFFVIYAAWSQNLKKGSDH